MAIDDRRIEQGQRVHGSLSVRTINTMVELVRRQRLERLGPQGGDEFEHPIHRGLETFVQNKTGAFLPPGSVVSVLQGTPLDPAGSTAEFLAGPCFFGTAPAHVSDVVAVMKDGADVDQLGLAVLRGLAVVALDRICTDHDYAVPVVGDVSQMVSATAGNPILWTATGEVGPQLAVVLLDGAPENSPCTTTTTTPPPCDGQCTFTWSAATQSWSQTASSCTAGCTCRQPRCCGTANGQTARTDCDFVAGPLPCCTTTTTGGPTTTTTTTGGPTTTTTTTAAPTCSDGCTWRYYSGPPRGPGWVLVSNGCSSACPCLQPIGTGSDCGTSSTPCTPTTTTTCTPCTGGCRWWWDVDRLVWVRTSFDCNAGTCPGGCYCVEPAYNGNACGQEAGTDCRSDSFIYDGTTTTAGGTTSGPTTTTTAGPCAAGCPPGACCDVCRWVGDGAGGWTLALNPCASGCVCLKPAYSSSASTEVACSPCFGGTTTTTSTTTTTTTSTTTTTTTTTTGGPTTTTTTTSTTTTTPCPGHTFCSCHCLLDSYSLNITDAGGCACVPGLVAVSWTSGEFDGTASGCGVTYTFKVVCTFDGIIRLNVYANGVFVGSKDELTSTCNPFTVNFGFVALSGPPGCDGGIFVTLS